MPAFKEVYGTYAANFWVNSGPLYSQDRILQATGNIALAFHLLCERASPNSFWQPYIQTLPSEYDTPLYFEEEEVRCLQSTQAIHDVFSQYKNTARQYAYFYKVIQVSRVGKKGELTACMFHLTSCEGYLNILLFKLKIFQ
jgi:hypothetical protein